MFKDSDMELILPGPAAASAYTHPTPEQDRRRRVFEHGQVRDAFAARPDGAHILFLCKTLFRMHSLSAELQSMILSHMPLAMPTVPHPVAVAMIVAGVNRPLFLIDRSDDCLIEACHEIDEPVVTVMPGYYRVLQDLRATVSHEQDSF